MASKKYDIEIIRTFATPVSQTKPNAKNMKVFEIGKVIRDCSSKLLIGLAEQGVVAKFIEKESEA